MMRFWNDPRGSDDGGDVDGGGTQTLDQTAVMIAFERRDRFQPSDLGLQ